MLQTGALIPDVPVHELIAPMAALHPDSLDVDEVLELVGIGELAERRRRSSPAGRRSASASRSR